MLGVAATSGPMLLVGLGAFGHCVRCKLHCGLVFTTLIFFFSLISLPSELSNRTWLLCCCSLRTITPEPGERRAERSPALLLDIAP